MPHYARASNEVENRVPASWVESANGLFCRWNELIHDASEAEFHLHAIIFEQHFSLQLYKPSFWIRSLWGWCSMEGHSHWLFGLFVGLTNGRWHECQYDDSGTQLHILLTTSSSNLSSAEDICKPEYLTPPVSNWTNFWYLKRTFRTFKVVGMGFWELSVSCQGKWCFLWEEEL